MALLELILYAVKKESYEEPLNKIETICGDLDYYLLQTQMKSLPSETFDVTGLLDAKKVNHLLIVVSIFSLCYTGSVFCYNQNF